jgi:hypothetical protein
MVRLPFPTSTDNNAGELQDIFHEYTVQLGLRPKPVHIMHLPMHRREGLKGTGMSH